MLRIIYKNIIKPILFLFPADDVHSFFLRAGNFLGKFSWTKWITNKLFFYKNEKLKQNILGINFENPVGLSAGFDYDADLIDILPEISFGFHTIGTVTQFPYKGNPRPMLGRLPKSKSLLVNKGFKSMGIEAVLQKIKASSALDTASRGKKRIPLGISIGSTNRLYANTDEMIDDIFGSFEKVLWNDYFDYYELNISCPNLINIKNLKDKFDEPIGFGMLLNKLSYLNFKKPVFVKMHLEKSKEETFELIEVAGKYNFIKGFVFSNLVKNRANPHFDKNEIENAGRGNFSGKPTEELSNNLITEVYKKYKTKFIIIGCGGIFTGSDAYEKIKRGATLIQMITGMIYEGPSQIGNINKDLAKLLQKDGYKNISEAIGAYHK